MEKATVADLFETGSGFPAFKGQKLRYVLLDGEKALFHATDACRILGYDLAKGTKNRLIFLAEDEKMRLSRKTPNSIKGLDAFIGATGEATAITESGLYKLIMRSDKPEAREFQDWVTREVLPAIRKTGGYLLNEEARPVAHAANLASMPVMAQIAQALSAAQGEIDRLAALAATQERELAEAAPKVEFVDTYEHSDGSIDLPSAARVLGYGPHKFNALLRQGRVLYSRDGKNRVFAQWMNRGYFREIPTIYPNGYAGTKIRVLPKGLRWLSERFGRGPNITGSAWDHPSMLSILK